MAFDNVEYWRRRAREKLKSTFQQTMIYVEEVEKYADHVDLDARKIKGATTGLIKAYKALDGAIEAAQVKKK